MWGNRQGWIISSVIMAVTIVLYAILLLGPSISPPTELTTRAGALDAMTLPGSPRSLLPGGGSDDGSDLYQQAIAAYTADSDVFDSYARGGKLGTPDYQKVLPAMDLLAQAGEASKASIFAKKPDSVVQYNPGQSAALKPIETLGRVANRIGMQSNIAKKTDEAKKYLHAEFALGYAMCAERLIYHELRIGQDLMRSASLNLMNIEPDKKADFAGIDPQYKMFMESQQTFIALCNPSDDRMIAANAGDVFNLAQNSQERMWRIEAILMLGHLRYNASQPGDQRGADKVLATLSAGSLDPAIATAVKAAQALTIEGHRTSQSMQ